MTSFFSHFKNPGLVPWLFIVLTTVTLTSLGAWQVQRLYWKQGMLAAIEAGQNAAPLTTLGKDTQDWDALRYKRVKFIGELDRETYFLRIGIHKNLGNGFYVLSPFHLPTNGSTKPTYLLANRGFIAGKQTEVKAKLEEENAPNPTMIQGILRPAYAARMFTPENHPELNMWSSEDIAAMSDLSHVILSPLVIEVTSEQPAEGTPTPTANKGEIRLRNDHLGYAVTWFLLALTGVIMFGFYCRR
jgi:surfeit locus 1 family protein